MRRFNEIIGDVIQNFFKSSIIAVALTGRIIFTLQDSRHNIYI